MFHSRPGVKFKLWTGGYTHRPSVDAPWLLKLVSVLAIFSMVGAIVYAVAMTITTPGIGGISTEDAIYVSILHFVIPIIVIYTITTNSPASRILIFAYIVTLYVSTIRGKGFLGSLNVDQELRIVASSAVLVAIALWLFFSPKMRFYYALVSGKAVPSDLESRAASFMDDSKLDPKWRARFDWISDHLETIVLLGFSILAVFAFVSSGYF